uniref:Uncharacterized protein n=1 Tax=Arcella intermedia TaxID=1963864 RepID=A0A6B2LW49_9EUKA
MLDVSNVVPQFTDEVEGGLICDGVDKNISMGVLDMLVLAIPKGLRGIKNH